MSKKIVRYRLDKPFVIHVGMTAYITPIDHPDCSNTGMVRTSEVIGAESTTFETKNTEYVGE